MKTSVETLIMLPLWLEIEAYPIHS